MQFPNGTILARTDQLPTEADELGLNRLRVIGRSPVIPNETVPGWENAKGDGWIVQPVDTFAANQVMPESIISSLYEVESYPEEDETATVVDPAKARRQQLESPEDVFARKAREQQKAAAVVAKK